MAAVPTFLLAGAIASAAWAGGCSAPPQPEPPLLVIAGPNGFVSFEVRSSTGEAIWRLEAETPSPISALVYAKVPEGFRQTLPAQSPPRPLSLGEDLILESRLPDRAFLHRAFADTAATVTVLATEMHRIPPPDAGLPISPGKTGSLDDSG
jgi:hypothetical protein